MAMTDENSSLISVANSELRLVLLGRKETGKSAAGNTILGGVGGFESGRPTEECVKRRADVTGRRVLVVDTPGWEWYYTLNSTPNWVRRETLRSVSLCPPGPHAVLLVVRSCTSMTDAYIKEIEEHLEPLGKGVWEQTMLLFTRGDELGLTTMEQRIMTSGPLQRLLQRCGNRYHVVNNRSKGDGTQVKELIRKLEQMVDGMKGGQSHLEMDSTVVLGLEADGKRRARERRKKQRQMEAQMQRGTIKAALTSDGHQGSELDAHQSFSKAPRRLPEVRLVLLGERETGKSSAGNTILGKICFFQAGAVTEECVRQQAEVAMRLVTLVDTPGWEVGVAGATPERVKREIVSSVAFCPPGPHALLLTLRVDTLVRLGHVKEHLELLGEGVWRHTILLFTHSDQLREGVDIEQHIQGGGRDLQWLLDKCRGRYHVISSVDGGGRGSGGSAKVAELLEKVEKMATTNRCEAFSCLVQEVRDLSRQRNEKYNQRLKEIGEKMHRQEAELKNMRDREMKSIRWFFDRKKKVKSPGKADIQREEEEDEDRRLGERKNDIGELEERIRWLTEDKEREIQDLGIENERIRVALNQSRREKDEAMLNLELKEREIEDLTERIDEQQVKLLDLERADVENEHERKQREEAIRAEKQEWRGEVQKLEESVELLNRDRAEWMEKVDSLKAEIEERKTHYDDVFKRKEQENKQEMTKLEENFKKAMEIKLLEKEKEQEELRRKASEEKQITLNNMKQYERDMERKVEEIKSQHEKEMEIKTQEKKTAIQEMNLKNQEEMDRKIREIKQMMETAKLQHQEDINKKLKEKALDIESLKQQHENKIRDIQQEKQREITDLKEKFTKEHKQARQKELAEIEQKCQTQIKEKMQENEKDKETIHLKHQKDVADKMQEKEKEIEALKLLHQEEMQKLQEEKRDKHQHEMDRKVKENKEDVERIQQQHMKNLKDMEEGTEKQLQERQREIRELEQKFAAQLEEKVQESEKEKEIIQQSNEKYILEKLQERDRLTEDLKRLHVLEIEEKMQESEKEKGRYMKETEKRMEEKEKEIEEVKLNVQELKKKLQQEEEKERDHVSYKNETEKRLEEKEKEIEMIQLNVQETKEKLQQMELIHVNYKTGTEKRLEEKERETEVLKDKLDHVEETLRETEKKEREQLNLKRQMEQKLEEKERVIEKLNQLLMDIEEILQRKEEERGEIILNQKKEAEQRLQDTERKMEEMKLQLLNEMEVKMQEKDAEIESIKHQAESREARWREEQRRKDEKGEHEMNKLKEIISEKNKEIKQVQHLLAQKDCEVDEAKKTCANYFQEIEDLRQSNDIQTSNMIEIQQFHMEKEKKRDAEVMERLQVKEEELEKLRQRNQENEKEIARLMLTIEQTKAELKNLTDKMEKEMAGMIQEYENEIARRNKNIESLAKEKDDAISRLEEQSQQSIADVSEKYEESLKRVEELQEQNEKMRKETDNLKIKYEELKEESKDEVRKHLRECEEQVKSKESEIQRVLKEKDLEVRALMEAKDKLQEEVERMKVRDDEAEMKMNELREHLEKQNEFRVEEIEQKILKWEKEVREREQDLSRNEEEVSRRGIQLDGKESGLVEKEAKLESKEQDLRKLEASLEIKGEEKRGIEQYEKDVKVRAQNVEKMEKELESLLRALEGKQKELSSHGHDLQKKVKGLKDQGKELKDREHYLKNEEQELLSWMSELKTRNEHVNSTTQQLDEMGRDLALLKEELQEKEQNLKTSLKKLSQWEQNLEAREAQLREREKKDFENGRHEAEDNQRLREGISFTLKAAVRSSKDDVNVMYQEVTERREEGRGREAESSKNREDQTRKTASAATESNNCHLKTLKEINVADKDGTTGRGDEMWRKTGGDHQETEKVTAEFTGHRCSNNKDPPGSALRVMVLGETWSSRSPAGVTILGGEPFRPDGSTFRCWSGQISSRHLALVEPLGLKWQDGPDPTDIWQRKSLQDSLSWCHPGPHIVLLLMPAFLTCTRKYRRAVEEHLNLLGEESWQRTLVLFTWGETLGVNAEQHILRNGELMELVERCGGRYHVLTSNTERLFEKMEHMVALNNRDQGVM